MKRSNSQMLSPESQLRSSPFSWDNVNDALILAKFTGKPIADCLNRSVLLQSRLGYPGPILKTPKETKRRTSPIARRPILESPDRMNKVIEQCQARERISTPSEIWSRLERGSVKSPIKSPPIRLSALQRSTLLCNQYREEKHPLFTGFTVQPIQERPEKRGEGQKKSEQMSGAHTTHYNGSMVTPDKST